MPYWHDGYFLTLPQGNTGASRVTLLEQESLITACKPHYVQYRLHSCNTADSKYCFLIISNAFQNYEPLWNNLENNLNLTQWAKVSPFLHNSMKKAKTKQQFLPHFWLLATAKEYGVRDGVIEVRSKEVCSDPFWRFICHFDTILENTNRKFCWWITG